MWASSKTSRKLGCSTSRLMFGTGRTEQGSCVTRRLSQRRGAPTRLLSLSQLSQQADCRVGGRAEDGGEPGPILGCSFSLCGAPSGKWRQARPRELRGCRHSGPSLQRCGKCCPPPPHLAGGCEDRGQVHLFPQCFPGLHVVRSYSTKSCLVN